MRTPVCRNHRPSYVVRRLYWPGLVPQFLAIATLSAAAWLWLPAGGPFRAILIGATVYLIFCHVMRRLLAHDHALGMHAYRARQFQEAVARFDASYRFFSAHPRLDASRSLLFGVASRDPYRVVALGNIAYCYGQLRDRAKAIEYYEKVLQEVPDHAVALSSLNLLRASNRPPGAA